MCANFWLVLYMYFGDWKGKGACDLHRWSPISAHARILVFGVRWNPFNCSTLRIWIGTVECHIYGIHAMQKMKLHCYKQVWGQFNFNTNQFRKYTEIQMIFNAFQFGIGILYTFWLNIFHWNGIDPNPGYKLFIIGFATLVKHATHTRVWFGESVHIQQVPVWIKETVGS